MKRTNIYLPDQTLSKLREMSEKSGISVAEIVRRAVDKFIKDQEKWKKKSGNQ